MKKEDIIAQKLFETCKLSEFYLKLIKNDDESPIQLVYAYKQKLNDIVERYDRLLEAHQQREQLKLTFDTSNNSKPPLAHSTSNTPVVSVGGVIHSPYKKLPHSASYTRLNLLSNANNSNLSSTPQHSSPNPYRSRFNTTNLFRNNNNSSTAPTTPIQSSSKFSTSVFNLSSLQQQHGGSNYNTLTKTRRSGLCNSSSSFNTTIIKPANKPHSKLDQRTAALYYDNDQNTSCESDNDDDDDERDDPENDLNDGSDEEDENEINEYDTEQRLIVKQHIEKSYSNLSKDSGMLSESYHSELNHTGGNNASSHLITTGNGSTNITAPSSSFLESNLNSPYSSNESKSAYDDDEEKETITSTSSQGFKNPSEEEENEPVKDLGANRINFNSLKQSFLLNQQLKQMPKHSSHSSNLLTINRQRLLDAKITERLNSLSNSRSSIGSVGSSSSSQSPLKKHINLKNLNLSEDTSSNNSLDDMDKHHLMSLMPTGTNSNLLPPNTDPTSIINHPNSNTLDHDNKTNDHANNMFMSSYNSLMNVSMLDNIQIANSNLVDYDNSMNSSILMFN